MKLISIILPVYNGEKHLAISIESCLNQTHRNIELIIVNDCSTDNTLQIANNYAEKDKRVKVINNENNKKLPTSLNIGHKKANGSFITWTSDDNIYEFNALEILLDELLEQNADIVYSNFSLINDKGNKIRDVQLEGIENIIFGNFIGCSFLYKKEVFERNNGYNELLYLVEDYDFWLRAILHSRYCQVKKVLYKYRIHQDSLTNQIKLDYDKNTLWKDNAGKMYENFCKSILYDKYIEIAQLQTKILTHQKIEFDWLKKNDIIIYQFKKRLCQNINFSNKRFLEKIFLKKMVYLMVSNKDFKSKILNSLFIIKKYFFVIDKNTFKTLIKYSFLNLNK
jgi:glycosyltransferase involved in cell wall biosynthesis